VPLIVSFVLDQGDENLLFRGNSFATKAMDYYMKMVGEEVRILFTFFSIMWIYYANTVYRSCTRVQRDSLFVYSVFCL
jgi:heme O synthase-like polyprenyltransferase